MKRRCLRRRRRGRIEKCQRRYASGVKRFGRNIHATIVPKRTKHVSPWQNAVLPGDVLLNDMKLPCKDQRI